MVVNVYEIGAHYYIMQQYNIIKKRNYASNNVYYIYIYIYMYTVSSR